MHGIKAEYLLVPGRYRRTCLPLYPVTSPTTTMDEILGNWASKSQNKNKKCKLKLDSMYGLPAVRVSDTMLYHIKSA